jgi:hypothetical protein
MFCFGTPSLGKSVRLRYRSERWTPILARLHGVLRPGRSAPSRRKFRQPTPVIRAQSPVGDALPITFHNTVVITDIDGDQIFFDNDGTGSFHVATQMRRLLAYSARPHAVDGTGRR